MLTEVGGSINQSIREMDIAARYGGEELAVIMPDTDREQASQVGERIREHIERLKFDSFSVTVSIGLAELNKKCRTFEALISSADKALYEAKRNGKNQLVVSQSTG